MVTNYIVRISEDKRELERVVGLGTREERDKITETKSTLENIFKELKDTVKKAPDDEQDTLSDFLT